MNIKGRTLRRKIVWAVLTMLAMSGLWILRVELVYRHNVQRIPALFNYHRHTVTRMWTT